MSNFGGTFKIRINIPIKLELTIFRAGEIGKLGQHVRSRQLDTDGHQLVPIIYKVIESFSTRENRLINILHRTMLGLTHLQ